MDDLQGSIALIEKREAHIQRLIDNEVVAARAHHAAGRKADALLAVKRKRLHDKERESLAAQKLNLITTEQQLSQMRFSSVIIDTQKKAAEALEREVKKVQGPEGAEAVADRLDDALADAADTTAATTRLIGQAADFDDDELLDELEQLELQEELQSFVDPTTSGATTSGVEPAKVPTHVPRPSVRAAAAAREEAAAERELEELATLRSSMALDQPMPMPMMAACY